MIYIVTYDLVEPGQNYKKLLELIMETHSWARLGGSSYLINSQDTAVQLREKFKRALDLNDKLYVGKVDPPAAWSGYSKDVSDWIKENL